MQFRFTLYDTDLFPAGQSIPQPIGWKDSAISLERHSEYHSLVEYFEGDFIFFGAGLTLLQSVETSKGPDARPRIVIELSSVIGVWELVYDGLIDLSLLEEFSYGRKMYKMKAPIIRDDFWSKFINRKSIPVNILGTTDLDGNVRTAVPSFVLPLPSQIITTKYRAEMYQYGTYGTEFIQFEFNYGLTVPIIIGVLQLPVTVSDTLEDRFTYTNGAAEPVSDTLYTFEFAVAKYTGVYSIDIQIVLSTSPYVTPFPNGDKVTNVSWYIQKNNETRIVLTATQLGTNGISGRTKYTYSAAWNLVKGDKITMYAYYEGALTESDTYFVVYNNVFEDTFIEITAATLFEDTETESVKIKDVAEGILSKLSGVDSILQSSALDSCEGKYSLQKIIHIRGKSLTDKPFTMSWDDFWNGSNPILNLGFGYTSDGKFKIEKKEHFYNATTVIDLSNVANIVRTYDLDKYYKSIQIGYEKGLSESDGGLDDPQTKATWSTRFATIGKDMNLLSKFIAASLSIEKERRNRVEGGKDSNLDEDFSIIALTDTDEVETGTSFELVTGLQNSDTRINIRLSCARNFERWRKWFNGCLQYDLTQKFHFASGQGNRTMTSELIAGDCEAGENNSLTENQDIDVTNMYTLIPKRYTFTKAFTWDQYKIVRDNPENAIGLSRGTDAYTPHFINKIKFFLDKGYADFDVMQATVPTELNGFRLLEDGNYRLLEDGERRLLN